MTVAAALDVQTAVQGAATLAAASAAQAQEAAATVAAILPTLQQAQTDANYFLSGDLRGLPTVPGAAGTTWNNGGDISFVNQ